MYVNHLLDAKGNRARSTHIYHNVPEKLLRLVNDDELYFDTFDVNLIDKRDRLFF